MKKWLIVIIIVLMKFCFQGCGGGLSNPDSTAPTETISLESRPWGESGARDIEEAFGVSPNDLVPFPAPEIVVEKQKVVIERRQQFISQANRSVAYNRNSAVQYALSWTSESLKSEPKVRNSNHYREWQNNCTNYVSQCLYAGGVPYFSGPVWLRYLPTYWWYRADMDSNGQSWSWTNAAAFNLFLFYKVGVAIQSTNVQDLERGDCIVFDWENNGFADHAVFVTSKSNGRINVSANSADHKDLPWEVFWRNILNNKEYYPNPTIYAWHIDSFIADIPSDDPGDDNPPPNDDGGDEPNGPPDLPGPPSEPGVPPPPGGGGSDDSGSSDPSPGPIVLPPPSEETKASLALANSQEIELSVWRFSVEAEDRTGTCK